MDVVKFLDNFYKLCDVSTDYANAFRSKEISDLRSLIEIYNCVHREERGDDCCRDFFCRTAYSKPIAKSMIGGKLCYLMIFPAVLYNDVQSCVSINCETLEIEQIQFEWQTQKCTGQGQYDPTIYRNVIVNSEDLKAISSLYRLVNSASLVNFTFNNLRIDLRSRSLRTLSDDGRKFWVIRGKEFLYSQLDKNFKKKGIKVAYVDTKELLTEQEEIIELRKRMR